MKLPLEQIARWTGAELVVPRGVVPAAAAGYSIDTRTLRPGDLFFAIRGERFDAHRFVPQALQSGAVAAVISESKLPGLLPEGHRHPLLVLRGEEQEPLIGLQRLAAAVRRHWGGRVVAITGSAGKTTTKEAVAAVLATSFRVLRSSGNLNNHFGLPLQLLRLEPEDEVAVIEMGMSAAGEIAALCRIAAPDWGVVTNVGNAHAEAFPDGVAGVARAKYELVAGLSPNARERAVAFLNADDPYVSQFGRDFPGRAVYYGTQPAADLRAEQIEERGAAGSRFLVVAPGEPGLPVELALLGRHNVLNALAAIAVGREAGIPLGRCAAALAALRPEDRRGQVVEWRGAILINDCYNSNPEALRSMIGALAAVPARRRILVAGEMLELGDRSAALHRECGQAAAEAGLDVVVGVRGAASEIVSAAAAGGIVSAGRQALFVESPQQAGAWLREHLRPGDAVLLKASRGVRLEQALAELGL